MAYRGIRTFELISFLRQGSRPCHLHFRRGSRWLPKDGRSLNPSCVQVPHPRRGPSEYRSSCGPRSRTIRPMSRSPVSSAAIATRSRYGETAMPSRAFPAFKMPRDPADRRSFPPDGHLHVISVASSDPADQGCSATRWSLDDIAQNIVNQTHYEAISRSTIWRILEEADLKPHKSVYWLNSHDPDFDAKAERICQLYVNSPRLYQHGELVICCDEDGDADSACKYATQQAKSGKRRRREYKYIRHGTGALLASFAVPTERWRGIWARREPVTISSPIFATPPITSPKWTVTIGFWTTSTRTGACRYCAGRRVVRYPSDAKTCGVVRQRRAFLSDPTHKHVFHFTPKHGSWLNQVELWFGLLGRRFLAQGDFRSAEDFEARLRAVLGRLQRSVRPSRSLDLHRQASRPRHAIQPKHPDRSNTAAQSRALDPKDSSDCFTRPDPINENSQHDWPGTYETSY